MKKLLFILLLITSLSLAESRCERLNNPGCLRSNIILAGETCKDSSGFSVFQTKQDGLRAMSRVLRNYAFKHHIDTIRGVITRYTTKDKRPKEPYIRFLCKRLKVNPDQHIDLKNRKFRNLLIKVMIHWENGKDLT